jgi:tetratricopeptide (TPR) repeat protein
VPLQDISKIQTSTMAGLTIMKRPAAYSKSSNSRIVRQSAPVATSGLHAALLQNGRRLMQARKYGEAAQIFDAILKDLPDHVEANYVMAQIATLSGATRNAVDHVRRALKHGTGTYAVHFAMAEVCMKHSLATEALTHIELALGLQPGNIQANALKANILQQLGHLDAAHALALSLIQKDPSNDDAINIFANTAKFNGNEPEIVTIEQAYENNPQPARLKYLGYSLGKIFNDAKQYDKAFVYFKSAADTYDVKNVAQQMNVRTQRMREGFTAEFIAEKNITGHQSRKPIFIVGMPRSGTTLTEQILASHPDVCGVGELLAMARMNIKISPNDAEAKFYLQKLQHIDKKQQHILSETYLNSLNAVQNNSKQYADKMPSNFFYIGLINIIFPNAKIIHCTRDPIDNCVSCFTSPLDETHLYTKKLEVLGQYYREYASLMDYWKTVSAIPIFDMKYETTVADLEGQARALIAHVGLPWNDACLKFNEAKTQVSTISTWQVRQPIYSTSVKRWKAYEKHLGPLIDALGDLADTD